MTGLFRSRQERKDEEGAWYQGVTLEMRIVAVFTLGDEVRLCCREWTVIGREATQR